MFASYAGRVDAYVRTVLAWQETTGHGRIFQMEASIKKPIGSRTATCLVGGPSFTSTPKSIATAVLFDPGS